MIDNGTDLHSREAETNISPVPRVTIQAFCERQDTASAISSAASDRRMLKAHIKVHMGGAPAAVEAFREAPTPNVIFIEASAGRAVLIEQLDALAETCDPGTKVVVVGVDNDRQFIIARHEKSDVVRDGRRAHPTLYTGDRYNPPDRLGSAARIKGRDGSNHRHWLDRGNDIVAYATRNEFPIQNDRPSWSTSISPLERPRSISIRTPRADWRTLSPPTASMPPC